MFLEKVIFMPGKPATEINPTELQQAITDLENKQAFTNRFQLWHALEQTEWAKTRQPRPLKAQAAMLKAKQFNLVIQTKLGKKGKQKREGNTTIAIPSLSKRSKKISLDIIEKLKKQYNEKYYKTIDKLVSGSMKAAIKLKCIDCSGHDHQEVKLCALNDCPLYPFRPYR